jgi:hypothetical protein
MLGYMTLFHYQQVPQERLVLLDVQALQVHKVIKAMLV